MKAREQQYLILGVVILMVLFAPPVRDAVERSMTTQVLLQLAGLAAGGWLLGMAIRRHLQRVMLIVNGNGVSGLLLGLFAMAFWMLPRTLDESLTDPYLEAAKLVTVPLLVGAQIVGPENARAFLQHERMMARLPPVRDGCHLVHLWRQHQRLAGTYGRLQHTPDRRIVGVLCRPDQHCGAFPRWFEHDSGASPPAAARKARRWPNG